MSNWTYPQLSRISVDLLVGGDPFSSLGSVYIFEFAIVYGMNRDGSQGRERKNVY